MTRKNPLSISVPTILTSRTAYAAQHPTECRQLDADPDTGGMEFTICKGRLSFRLTAPYSEKRKQAASEAANRNGFNRKP